MKITYRKIVLIVALGISMFSMAQTNKVAKFTSTTMPTGLTQSVIFDDGNKLGIGTVSPVYKLDVQTVAPTKAAYFQTSGSWQAIDFSSDGGVTKGSLSANGNKLYIGSAASGTNALQTIDLTNGKIGIGPTTPLFKLHVSGFEDINWLTAFQNTGTNGHKIYMAYNQSSGTGQVGLRIMGGDGSATTQDLEVGPGKFNVRGDGNVGINTTAPDKKLTVIGDVSFTSYNSSNLNSFQILGNAAIPVRRGISLDNDPNGAVNFYVNSNQTNPYFNFLDGNPTATNVLMRIDASNKMVVINDVPSNPYKNANYKLAVNGKVIAEEFLVKLRSAGWPDYVFNEQYKLIDLKEMEDFINENKHLPGIPSAKEVETNGISLGDIVTKQMEKIEELSLYLIKLNKKIEALEIENQQLKASIKK